MRLGLLMSLLRQIIIERIHGLVRVQIALQGLTSLLSTQSNSGLFANRTRL